MPSRRVNSSVILQQLVYEINSDVATAGALISAYIVMDVLTAVMAATRKDVV